MRNKELVQVYNELLPKNLSEYKLKTFDDIKNFDLDKLQKLFDFFSNEFSKKGLSQEEVNSLGEALDDILGKINTQIIIKKSH